MMRGSFSQRLLHFHEKQPAACAGIHQQVSRTTGEPNAPEDGAGYRQGSGGPASDQRREELDCILTILLPNLGVKAGVTSTRELKTLGTKLDLLAQGSRRGGPEDPGGRAAPENSMLLDKDEEIYVSKEYLLDQQLRQ